MDAQVHEWLAEMDRKRKFQRSYKMTLSLAASFVGLCILFPPLGMFVLVILIHLFANRSQRHRTFDLDKINELPVVLSDATDSVLLMGLVKILAFVPLITTWHLYRNPPKLLYPDLSPEDLEFFGTKIPFALNTPVDAETQEMLDEINRSS
jgi:hypothetical protein